MTTKKNDNRVLKSVKITKKTVEATFQQVVETESSVIDNDTTIVYRHAVHPDFEEAMSELKKHLYALTVPGCSGPGKADQQTLDLYYHVSGFYISGRDEKEGVIITGRVMNNYRKWTAINSPLTRFQVETDYSALAGLFGDIQLVIDEAKNYIDKKKIGKGSQMELTFEREQIEEMED